MFRRGGQADGGITTGLRRGYTHGGQTGMERIPRDLQLIDKLAPSRGMAGPNFLMNLGLNLVSNPPSGNILQTLATEAKGPFQQFQQTQARESLGRRELISNLVQNLSEDDKYKLQVEAQHMFDNNAINPFTNKPFASPTEALNALIKNKLMSKERILTEEAKFENTYNSYLEDILREKLGDFANNRLGASTLATHEAKIQHKQYPETLVEEFDLTQTYIPIGAVDWGNPNTDGSFKLTGVVGTQAAKAGTIKPDKIYFNVSDKSFYKFNGKSFTVIDIAEYK